MPRKKVISEEKFRTEFGQRLRALRKSKGISLKQLEAMDDSMDRSNLSKLENGHLAPTAYTVLKLASLLEEDVSTLYYGKKKED